jgi:hypothetical protein
MKTTKDPDLESVLALSERLVDVSQGFKTSVVMKAAVNLCATAIAEGADTLDEAEDTAEDMCATLDKAVKGYWQAKRPH